MIFTSADIIIPLQTWLVSDSFADLCTYQAESQQTISSIDAPRRKQYDTFFDSLRVATIQQTCRVADRSVRSTAPGASRFHERLVTFSLDGTAASRNPIGSVKCNGSCYEVKGHGTVEFPYNVPPTLRPLGGWLRLHGHSLRKP